MADTTSLYDEAEKLKDDGKLEEAIQKLHDLLEIDPGHVLSHLALAVIYGRVGQHEQAIKHGENACELEPNESFNFTAMSVTYRRAWTGTQQQAYVAKAEDAMAKARVLEGTPGH